MKRSCWKHDSIELAANVNRVGGHGDAAHLGGRSVRDLDVDACRDAHRTREIHDTGDVVGSRNAVVEYPSSLCLSLGTNRAL